MGRDLRGAPRGFRSARIARGPGRRSGATPRRLRSSGGRGGASDAAVRPHARSDAASRRAAGADRARVAATSAPRRGRQHAARARGVPARRRRGLLGEHGVDDHDRRGAALGARRRRFGARRDDRGHGSAVRSRSGAADLRDRLRPGGGEPRAFGRGARGAAVVAGDPHAHRDLDCGVRRRARWRGGRNRASGRRSPGPARPRRSRARRVGRATCRRGATRLCDRARGGGFRRHPGHDLAAGSRWRRRGGRGGAPRRDRVEHRAAGGRDGCRGPRPRLAAARPPGLVGDRVGPGRRRHRPGRSRADRVAHRRAARERDHRPRQPASAGSTTARGIARAVARRLRPAPRAAEGGRDGGPRRLRRGPRLLERTTSAVVVRRDLSALCGARRRDCPPTARRRARGPRADRDRLAALRRGGPVQAEHMGWRRPARTGRGARHRGRRARGARRLVESPRPRDHRADRDRRWRDRGRGVGGGRHRTRPADRRSRDGGRLARGIRLRRQARTSGCAVVGLWAIDGGRRRRGGRLGAVATELDRRARYCDRGRDRRRPRALDTANLGRAGCHGLAVPSRPRGR